MVCGQGIQALPLEGAGFGLAPGISRKERKEIALDHQEIFPDVCSWQVIAIPWYLIK